jgi:hypothetical protein
VSSKHHQAQAASPTPTRKVWPGNRCGFVLSFSLEEATRPSSLSLATQQNLNCSCSSAICHSINLGRWAAGKNLLGSSAGLHSLVYLPGAAREVTGWSKRW